MKRIVIISGALLFCANLMLWAVMSSMGLNLIASSVVILFTTLILLLVNIVKLKDAFRFSLNVLFAFGGFVEYLLSAFAPPQIEDNWSIMVVVGLILLEVITFVVVHTVSSKIK